MNANRMKHEHEKQAREKHAAGVSLALMGLDAAAESCRSDLQKKFYESLRDALVTHEMLMGAVADEVKRDIASRN